MTALLKLVLTIGHFSFSAQTTAKSRLAEQLLISLSDATLRAHRVSAAMRPVPLRNPYEQASHPAPPQQAMLAGCASTNGYDDGGYG
jgi:hypothetical protein